MGFVLDKNGIALEVRTSAEDPKESEKDAMATKPRALFYRCWRARDVQKVQTIRGELKNTSTKQGTLVRATLLLGIPGETAWVLMK
jgi:hypothetical protein